MANFFEKLGSSISNTGQKVYDKTSVFAGKAVDATKNAGHKAKLKSDINSENYDINKAFQEIGRFYYDKYRENPDEIVMMHFDRVNQGLANIAAMEAELRVIEAQENNAAMMNQQYQMNQGYPQNGMPMQGQPMMQGGMPMQGQPMTPNGMPMQGQPMTPNGMPMQGQPMTPNGMPMQGQPVAPNGMPMQGQPVAPNGMPMQGQPIAPDAAPQTTMPEDAQMPDMTAAEPVSAEAEAPAEPEAAEPVSE